MKTAVVPMTSGYEVETKAKTEVMLPSYCNKRS